MNNQNQTQQTKPPIWNSVLVLIKKYWWVYPLWWILKLAAVAAFGLWLAA